MLKIKCRLECLNGILDQIFRDDPEAESKLTKIDTEFYHLEVSSQSQSILEIVAH